MHTVVTIMALAHFTSGQVGLGHFYVRARYACISFSWGTWRHHLHARWTILWCCDLRVFHANVTWTCDSFAVFDRLFCAHTTWIYISSV